MLNQGNKRMQYRHPEWVSLRTGSQRGRKKNSASESERRDSASEASGTRGPGSLKTLFSMYRSAPWWLACYIAVKEVIKPVKIDGFPRADESAITIYRTQHSQQY